MTAAWPLPALLAWLAAWAVHLACSPRVGPVASAVLAALALCIAAPHLARSPWRRAIVALGFPVSFAISGALSEAVSPWLWLLPLGALALVYPMGAWRDAPLFPTPRGALAGLGATLPLPDGACVLDAGCGTGDALAELAREYPRAALAGVERSWPVALAARLRLGRRATIARGDLWAGDWSALDLVYVFQRPESMGRIADKALREMRGEALLASLEFPIAGALAVFTGSNTRRLFVYRVSDLPMAAGRPLRSGPQVKVTGPVASP